jgi:hypothetical protein
MVGSKALSDALKDVIWDYTQGHKGHSLSTLAKSAGVGYTTVRRIAQGEAIPNQETTLAIIDVALKTEEKIHFLKTHYPKIGKLLEEAYSSEVLQTDIDDKIRYFLNLELHNFVFNLAATAAGTSVEQISKLTGIKGLEALDEMVDNGVLNRDSTGKVRFKNGSWALTNVSDALRQVQYSVSYFNKDLIGTEAATIAHVTASVNETALCEIHKMVKDFVIRLIKFKDAPSSKGDIPFYTDILMNLYDKYKYSNHKSQ